MEITRGCVYFFKHVGLTPIKIGYSENESPINRFNNFKTFAPYGSEIIGFIIISDAKEVEHALHKKYSNKRLNGEWYDLSIDEVMFEINFYTKVSDIKEKNEFQIAWAKHIQNKKDNVNYQLQVGKKVNKFQVFKKLYYIDKDLNRSRIADEIGVTRQTIIKWIKQMEG